MMTASAKIEINNNPRPAIPPMPDKAIFVLLSIKLTQTNQKFKQYIMIDKLSDKHGSHMDTRQRLLIHI